MSVYIGNQYIDIPVIQGGMGIGVSRSSLAGAVAKEGGMGTISAAQIGYDLPLFKEKPEVANLQMLPVEIRKAKYIAQGKGMIAVNIMSVTQLYSMYVKSAVDAGADAIISGAGLPIKLPEHVQGTDVKIAPVVSSQKGAAVILKMWDKKYQATADFLIMESPFSGGHQGYKRDGLKDPDNLYTAFEDDVRRTVQMKKYYEIKYNKRIPLFVAGGIFSKEDTAHVMELGADGVQVGTRFIATEECDASDAYKEVFLKTKPEDLMIIESPVGMPARAVRNPFVERMIDGREEITFCYNCLKACNPKTAKYCISQALINAVKGDIEDGLIFCSEKIGELQKIQTVHEVINAIVPDN